MDISKEKKALKKFGFTFSAVLMLWGCLFIVRQRQGYIHFFILSAFFFFSALFLPYLLRPIQKIWMILAICLSWSIKIITLNFIYFLILTPTALLAKLFGKKFMDLDFSDNKTSYWISKKRSEFDKKSYAKQF